MTQIKNSQLAIQIIQNQSPISFLISMKTIIISCSIWAFFGFNWVMGPGLKTKRSQLKLPPLFQKSLIVSDFGPIFKYHTQRMERTNQISRCRTLCKVFWKKLIKKMWNILEARLAVTGEVFFFDCFDWLKRKSGSKKNVKKYSTILVITKIYVFFLLYFTSVLLLIMQSQPASIAWTVTSTAGFYHCWSYTEHSHLLWIRCDIFYINKVCPYETCELICNHYACLIFANSSVGNENSYCFISIRFYAEKK